jgi:hypothetical protein
VQVIVTVTTPAGREEPVSTSAVIHMQKSRRPPGIRRPPSLGLGACGGQRCRPGGGGCGLFDELFAVRIPTEPDQQHDRDLAVRPT